MTINLGLDFIPFETDRDARPDPMTGFAGVFAHPGTVTGHPSTNAARQRVSDLVTKLPEICVGSVHDLNPGNEQLAHDSSSPVVEGVAAPCDATVEEAAGSAPVTLPGALPEGGGAA